MAIAVSLSKLLAALALAAAAWIARAPFVAEMRPWIWIAATAGASALLYSARRDCQRAGGPAAALAGVTLVTAAFALGSASWVEGQFHHQRWRVHTADPALIATVGQHVMVGYRNANEVRRLVEKRAIGGIFVTRRNVAGKSIDAIAAEIAGFQAIRAVQGLPPLWVATDQEGGGVSRLSPPLTRLPVLAEILRGVAHEDQLDEARLKTIDDYAATHGRELASVGVNLNFAPVVDIDHGLRNPQDAFSRIGERAISRDPGVVAAVTSRYCDGLARHGVRCTLKHFPGLGRVYEDTHVDAGRLNASLAELTASDWVPFARVGGKGGHFAMVGHVVARAIDPHAVATLSTAVVRQQLRPMWAGPVITDDMCMGPIFWGSGIGRSGIQALWAGIDMLLVSWDGAQVYPLLSALLDAAGHYSWDDLAVSRRRLKEAMPATTPRATQ